MPMMAETIKRIYRMCLDSHKKIVDLFPPKVLHEDMTKVIGLYYEACAATTQRERIQLMAQWRGKMVDHLAEFPNQYSFQSKNG